MDRCPHTLGDISIKSIFTIHNMNYFEHITSVLHFNIKLAASKQSWQLNCYIWFQEDTTIHDINTVLLYHYISQPISPKVFYSSYTKSNLAKIGIFYSLTNHTSYFYLLVVTFNVMERPQNKIILIFAYVL